MAVGCLPLSVVMSQVAFVMLLAGTHLRASVWPVMKVSSGVSRPVPLSLQIESNGRVSAYSFHALSAKIPFVLNESLKGYQ